MTTKWLAGATAATLYAAMTLAPVSIATAQPKNPASDYSKCVGNALVARGQDVNPTNEQFQAASFDCCVIIGGQWVGNYPAGYCDVSNTSYDPSRNPPPPGATAILPPDVNTRAGTQ
jgi:hypothetical protein